MKEFKNLEFVGRESEIEQITDSINTPNGTKMFFIKAGGGVGKTRLLKEIKRKEYSSSNIFLSEIIDIIDVNISSSLGIENKLFEKVSNIKDTETLKYTETFKRRYNDYIREQNAVAKEKYIKDVQQALVSLINEKSEKSKIVLFFDTLDDPQIKDKNLERFIVEVLVNLKNTTTLLAGRDCGKDYIEKLKIKSEFIELNKLTEDQSKGLLKYIEDDEMKTRIAKLADGKPLLLHLVNFLYNKSNVLPDIFYEKVDSENDVNELRHEFEKELITPYITRSDIPHHSVIIQMAYCEKRYNKEILKQLNDLNDSEVEQILKELEQYFFIKPFANTHMLHDLFLYLVKIHYWGTQDRSGVIRRECYDKLKIHYQEEIKNKTEEIEKLKDEEQKYKLDEDKTLLIYEYCFYMLKEEREEAIRYIAQIIKEEHSLKKHITTLAKKLVELIFSEVSNLEKIKQICSHEYYVLKREISWQYFLKSEFKLAKEKTEEVLNEDKEDNKKNTKDEDFRKRLCNYYQNLGWILKEMGDPGSALEKFELAQQYEKSDEAKAWNHNNMASLYIDQGHIQKAISEYEKAIEITIGKEKLERLEALSSQRLGLAYIYKGLYNDADYYLNTALAYYEENNELHNLNVTKLYFAYLNTEKGNFNHKDYCYEDIEEFFEKEGNKTWITTVKVFKEHNDLTDILLPKAGQFRHSADKRERIEKLNKTIEYAKQVDEETKKYVKKYYPESILITGLQLLELAETHHSLREEKDANKAFDEAIEKIEESHNAAKSLRIKVKSLTAKAFYHYYKEDIGEIYKSNESYDDYFDEIPKIFQEEETESTEFYSRFDHLYSTLSKKNDNTILGKMLKLSSLFIISELRAYLGEVYLLIARLLFKEEKYEDAFRYYKYCVGYLAEPGLYPINRFPDFLEEILSNWYFVITFEGGKYYDKYYKWINIYEEFWVDKPYNKIYDNEQRIIQRIIKKYRIKAAIN